MANKDLTITLRTKNMLSAGLSQAQASVKGFSDRLKGLFDIGAKPILVIGAGVMALKKGIDFAEEGIRGFGRAMREQRSEELKAQFERLKESITKLQAEYAKTSAVFATNNKVFDEAKKSARGLEEANTSLEKAKRLSTATTEDERNAIEAEYASRDIATKSAQAQQDIIDEVARKRTEASMKEAQATKLEVQARELGKKSVEALSRAAQMASQESSATGSFLGFSGVNSKELESLKKAKDEATNLAKQYRDEQTKVNADVAKLRMESSENIRVSAETEKTIESEKIKAQAENLELQRKANEELIKLEEEKAKKLEELKRQEVDAQKSIEDNARDAQRKAWEDQVRKNEDIAKKTVAQFIDDSRKKKEEEKGIKGEDKRGAKLMADEARGTKLSPRDKEWLDSFKAIREAGVNAGVGKNNLEQIDLMNITTKQQELQAQLTNIVAKQNELLQAN